MKRRNHIRSLVVGASGQVGSQIVATLGPGAVVPTSRSPRQGGWLELDLAALAGHPDDALRVLRSSTVEAVYCIGGMTDVEGCESRAELAMQTNCGGPAALAEAAGAMGIPFVCVSTEYVFDGRSGPYREDDAAHPLSAYGESKWRGELAVQRAHGRALIVRTTVVYGPDDCRKNFLYSLRAALLQGRSFRVACDQISTPTFNVDLAFGVVQLTEDGKCGVFHVCGPEVMTRLEFARRAGAAMGLDIRAIVGIDTVQLNQKASRPLRAGLAIDKLKQTYPDLNMRTVEEAIRIWGSIDPELSSG